MAPSCSTARHLHEVYLPHFKRVVDEGVASIMSAYNSLSGEWAGQNRDLLTGILRDQWGFQGFVQSDWMFGVRDAKRAALAGQNVEMPLKNVFHRFLPDLVDNGEVPESVVDVGRYSLDEEALRRQFTIKQSTP